MKRITITGPRLLPALVVAWLVAGCQSIGPATIPRDRIDYGAAVSDSWKEQTLLNIVKIRYFDTPMFVEVASMISSYQSSKRAFTFLRMFSSIAETGVAPQGPVLTIPAN